MKVDVVASASTRHTQHPRRSPPRVLIHLRRAPPPRAPPPRAPPPRAPPPSSCRRRLERDSASRAPPPRAPPPCVPPPRAPPPCAPPLLRESARINRDKEGLRKQRPHATVASPPSVRPRDVRRLLWSCFCIWQPSAVLSSVSPLQKAWSARMNVNARGDDSYCSEHCVAPTRVVGEHGLSGSGRRLAIVTAKRYARWTRPTGADVIGPGKVSHIHSTTRFPFRDMATVIEISRSGESTRGHAATTTKITENSIHRICVGWPPLIMPQRVLG